MTVPGWFARQLAAESDNRLRVRWSGQTQRFAIEAKVGRPVAMGRPIDAWDDAAIRQRDGYELVMEVAPGDRSRCPRCASWTRLPIRRVGEARCAHCSHTFRACFWPLNESLLQHLRYIDPDRGGIARVFQDVDASEARRERQWRRQRHNDTEAIWKEDYNRLVGIPSVGYTGARHA
jgi:hypothetical protein